jgi:hypothetical protein
MKEIEVKNRKEWMEFHWLMKCVLEAVKQKQLLTEKSIPVLLQLHLRATLRLIRSNISTFYDLLPNFQVFNFFLFCFWEFKINFELGDVDSAGQIRKE